MATIIASAAGGASNTTGAWAGGVIPTAADDVQLNATSGNITITSTFPCRSFDCTGYTGGLTLASSSITNIGDATAGLSNIALKFSATMTLTIIPSTVINFISTSATQQTIDWGGQTTGSVTFNGIGSSYRFVSGHTTLSNSTVTHTNGTIDINNQSCSWGLFSSNGSTVRTLTLGTSAITLSGVGTVWNGGGVNANYTITTNTATVTCTGNGMTFAGNGRSFNGMSLVLSGAGSASITGVNTFANLTRTGTAAKTDSFTLSNDQIVTGTFTVNGNSAVNRVIVQSSTLGTARTITAATVSASNVDFMDITGAGAGSWNLNAITGGSGDCGGNTSITFTTSSTQTWSGTSGGNWSTNAWTSRVPLSQDDVVISSAFVASQTVTADMPRLGRSINWTGTTGSPGWTFSQNPNTIFGSLTMASSVIVNSTANNLRFSGRSTYNVTTAGVSFACNIQVYAPNGSYTMQDAFTTTGTFDYNFGGWNTNGFTWSMSVLASNVTNARTLTLGTSTVNLTANGNVNVWLLNAGGLTFSGSSSTITISTTSSTTRTFAGGSLNYGTFNYTVAGSVGTLTVTGSNTFVNFNVSDGTNARTLNFTAGTTTTFTGTFNVTGASGKLITIQSSTGATHTLSKSSGTVNGDYLNITNSIATGGATWNAGANSISAGNNTGWIFTGLQFVRTSQLSTGAGSTLTIPLSGTAVAGDFIVIHAKIGGTFSTTFSATDNASTPNTYVLVPGAPFSDGTNLNLQLYGVQITGGATSVTLTWSGGTSARVTVDEFSGGASTNATLYNSVSTGNGNGTTASVSSFTPPTGSLIAVGFGFAAAGTFSAGTGYNNGTANSFASSMYKLSSNGAETAPASWTAGSTWYEIAAAYNPASTTSNNTSNFFVMF